ncbi:hypothetical protein [Bradyrhizobium lablabi]|uniref:hypothetical protein n=1 Tax=Bradyrhizobium lablabi TaxID=722472 RepID=UPI001BA5DFCE|nr:hypothetical protein [Bradyrhizobium lablabi]MBR0698040.1 hypothetical protein [Bradyrhizobium lablabi]
MTAQDDKNATSLVQRVLKDPAIGEISFQMGDVSVSPTMYQKVSQEIANGNIMVIVQPDVLKANEAGKYFRELKLGNTTVFDVLVLRFPDLGDRSTPINEQSHRIAAIVHECTHAGFNVLKVPNMTNITHESGAYIAQSIFVIAKMFAASAGHPERVHLDRVRMTDPIEKAAWDVAVMLHDEAASANTPAARYYKSPDYAVKYWQTLSKVFTAISVSDEYKKIAKDKVKNVGVGRVIQQGGH